MDRLPGYDDSLKKRKGSLRKKGGGIRQDPPSYQHLSFLGENMGHTVIYPNLFHVADHLRQNVYHENMFQVMRVLLHFANLLLGDPPCPWGQPKMCLMSSRGNPSLTSKGIRQHQTL